ncbi:uncharacterized protein LOC129869697 [Solanum dulcamara]|uniref:uncharacterized protein LOC129869697 n=1 Tax=Solanum dulcamara TaxID=45834 RepID=UPI002485D1DE|nr:uncharacterized protein LOC129869697 [Solanum dulcamara]
MDAPWPFSAWEMDVIRPIEPKASNGHRFILLAIDYLTKWVKVVTFKVVTKKMVVYFVHSNIICRFGISRTIITDNAANLNGNLMKDGCEQFKIVHHNSSLYHPKANVAVEAANKNIKKILKKMVQGTRQWHEKFPFTLFGYRTIVRTLIGATPYLLMYGIKLYQQKMARAYNKREHPRHFEVGQLALKCIFPHQEEAKGKFVPNWQGPYLIKEALSKGALHLTDVEGKITDIIVNVDAVKIYYI